jgi:hypothetical protein
MIPPRHISLQTAYKQLADQEARDNGRGPDNSPAVAGRLLHKLVTGGLQAFQFDAKGEAIPVDVDEWREESEVFNRKLGLDRAYGDVAIFEDDLRAMLRPPDRSVNSAVEVVAPNRGRPPHDRDKLCAAVALSVHENGIPTTQAAMTKNTQAMWAEIFGEGDTPGDTALDAVARAVVAENRKREAKQKGRK